MRKRYQRDRQGRSIWLLTVGIALMLTTGCDSEENCANIDVQALQSAIDNYTANGIAPDPQAPDIKTSLPGILLGITLDEQDNCTLVSGASQIDTSKGTPTAPLFLSDKIRIGSITKTFVATRILDLINSQKLHLGDTLNTYLPELNVPYGDTITIKQLLNMTSGVPNYLSDATFFTNYYTNPTQSYTPQELVAVALQQTSQPPGTVWSYSNTNYILLGLIAEKVAPGFSLEAQMQELINGLGLLNTTFPGDTTNISGRHSHGYSSQYVNSSFDSTTILDETASNPTSAWAAGAMISTLGDQMFWIKTLIQNARTNPARLQGNEGDLSGLPICYGLGLMDLTYNNAHYIGHGGEIIGYTGVIFYRPDKNAYISIFINRFVISEAVLGTPNILSDVVAILWPDDAASVAGAVKSFRQMVFPKERRGLMNRQSSSLTSCTIRLSQ